MDNTVITASKRSPFLLALLAIAFALAWQYSPREPSSFAVTWPPINTNNKPYFDTQFASNNPVDFVHASSVAQTGGGNLIAAWFAGSREGGRDVTIKSTRFDASTNKWSEEVILATPWDTQVATKRWVKKLGNPVITLAPDGRLWLFYVSVAAGGWAASAINTMHSDDLGNSWSQPRRLITTPFVNISTLVKAAPTYYQDGTMALPVYHEFMGKFAEILHIDQQGNVLNKTRITHKKYSLQPVLLPSIGKQPTLALMRNAGSDKMLLASISDDGGQSWQASYRQSIANPNSALAAIRRSDDSLIAILNNTKDGRHQLALAYSIDNGNNWIILTMLEQHGFGRRPKQQYLPILEKDFFASSNETSKKEAAAVWPIFFNNIDVRMCKELGCKFSYDYPYMIKGKNGIYHLVYSWNKSFIKHVSFNDAWLEQQL
ncbi:MAG: putative neuraminidase [Flavobacteriales bacterium]|jgi:predicted neuraminidase